ncbi:MAG: pol polyprotein, partial [Kangiellaceae bacterium]|nr:pol polyprotein [Kangiellaceae bacterium]
MTAPVNLYVSVKFAGRWLNALIDTGAAVTLMRASLANRVHGNLHESNVRLLSADDTELKLIGCAKVQLRVGGVQVVQCVHFAEDLAVDMLLGCDFLKQNDVSVRPALGVLTFESSDVCVPTRETRHAPNACPILIAERVCIMPGQIMAVPVCPQTADWSDCGAPGVLERLKAAPPVAIGRSLNTLRSSMIASVLNAEDEEVVLEAGTALGQFTPLAARTFHRLSQTPTPAAHAPPQAEGQADSPLPQVVVSPDLSEEERESVLNVVRSCKQAFATEADVGRTSRLCHRIDTGNAPPIRTGLRRAPAHVVKAQGDLVKEMLDKGVIQPSSSPWASPVVLVKKKDGNPRFCVDYRQLNALTKPDAYPMPRIDDTIDALAGNSLFSALDLQAGFWQVEMDKVDKEKTAFLCQQGLYEFNVMPFGLRNAPATFQRLMQLVLNGLLWEMCLVYVDDVIVMGRNLEEHNERLRCVLTRLIDANLKLKPAKCRLAMNELNVLGYRVSAEGVSVDDSKFDAVRNWPVPADAKQVRGFLGLASYYRRFVPKFAELSEPLRQLTRPTVRFEWSEECAAAFASLKCALLSPPVLALPDMSENAGEFVLDTDASDVAIGCVLSQVQKDAGERVVAYGSRALTPAERNYCVTRKELLAVVEFIRRNRACLIANKFKVRVDHQALTHLLKARHPSGQLARWLETLQEFDFIIQYRPGVRHANADAVSRAPQSCPRSCEACRPTHSQAEVQAGTGQVGMSEAGVQAAECVNACDAGVQAAEYVSVNEVGVQAVECVTEAGVQAVRYASAQVSDNSAQVSDNSAQVSDNSAQVSDSSAQVSDSSA